MTTLNLTKRIGVALVVLQKLREALEANGNQYTGSLVPNLTRRR